MFTSAIGFAQRTYLKRKYQSKAFHVLNPVVMMSICTFHWRLKSCDEGLVLFKGQQKQSKTDLNAPVSLTFLKYWPRVNSEIVLLIEEIYGM